MGPEILINEANRKPFYPSFKSFVPNALRIIFGFCTPVK